MAAPPPPPPPPPGPPQTAFAQPKMNKKQDVDRGALLGSINNFKGGLKKVKTNDRSSPLATTSKKSEPTSDQSARSTSSAGNLNILKNTYNIRKPRAPPPPVPNFFDSKPNVGGGSLMDEINARAARLKKSENVSAKVPPSNPLKLRPSFNRESTPQQAPTQAGFPLRPPSKPNGIKNKINSNEKAPPPPPPSRSNTGSGPPPPPPPPTRTESSNLTKKNIRTLPPTPLENAPPLPPYNAPRANPPPPPPPIQRPQAPPPPPERNHHIDRPTPPPPPPPRDDSNKSILANNNNNYYVGNQSKMAINYDLNFESGYKFPSPNSFPRPTEPVLSQKTYPSKSNRPASRANLPPPLPPGSLR